MADLAGANGNRENFRVVGKPNLPGLTSYAMATGVAKFGSDFTVPDMLFAKILRSPYAHARVLSIDSAVALAIPGVTDVVKWDDPIFSEVGNDPMAGTKPSFLLNEAHKEGQEVGAIVIAESEALCEEGLRALKIEWEELPFIVDIEKGLDPDFPAIRGQEYDESGTYGAPTITKEGHPWMVQHYPEDPRKVGNVSWSTKSDGDVAKGWSEADFVLEYDVNVHDVVSLLPNPQASVAWWSEQNMYKHGETLRIEGAVGRRGMIAQMYGLPADNVIQEGLFQGGKYCDWGLRMSQEITPLLSKKAGKPVRCCNTREENFDMCVNERHAHIRLGVKKNGLITAVEDSTVIDHGAPNSSEMTTYDRDWNGYYSLKCENIIQRYTIVDSNRSFMYTCGQFVPYSWDMITVGLYLISEKLGIDPTEIARLNLHGPDSQKDTRPVPSFEACLEEGKKLMDWQWHKAGTKRLPDGRLHGAAFRYQMCPRHAFLQYFTKLEYRDGVVHLPTQGPIAGWFGTECFTMIAAEELGLNYEDICVDYDYRAQHTDEAGGSDGVTGHGWIVKECANILKKKILDAAVREAEIEITRFGPVEMPKPPSPIKGYTADELDIADGKVFVKSDPSRFVPFSSATSETITAEYGGNSPKAAWSTEFGRKLDTMNTSWCEVAVDEETGEVEILKYGVVIDPGKVIRRTSLESQIDQVVYFSQGAQLLEEYILDPETGVKLNANMIDYRKPTTLDVPVVDKGVLETRAGNGAYGASGIAHNLANSHMIVTAIHNAIGVWVDPPATPDRVIKALANAAAEKGVQK
ncbi:MAG: molybdopterin-dependent oxidoreductase [Oscillospiraceae bacterium]|jgi:xanthine dehydrogenase molybdenum-binding subunit|nr:molybdopterin-dependent oxidoreductase [Oscillospiraceae bacterium]